MLALAIFLALPAAQLPSWDFRWDADACCCGKAGPCPCPDHDLPHQEDTTSLRACGSGGNYVTSTPAPVLGLPPSTIAIAPRLEPATIVATVTAPHAAPPVERPRGPS